MFFLMFQLNGASKIKMDNFKEALRNILNKVVNKQLPMIFILFVPE